MSGWTRTAANGSVLRLPGGASRKFTMEITVVDEEAR